MITVILAEDNYLVREGVRQLLDEEPDVDVVGVGVDFGTVVAAIEQQAPDLVVTDIRMPPSNTDEGLK